MVLTSESVKRKINYNTKWSHFIFTVMVFLQDLYSQKTFPVYVSL